MFRAELICMRHAQSDNVILRRAGALPDAELTDLGRHQAAQAISYLRSSGAKRICASTARRARQTAEIVAELLAIPVSTVAGLEEVFIGDSEGATDDVTHQRTAEALHSWILGDLDDRVADGETGHQVTERMTAALTAIADEAAGSPVIVIGQIGRASCRERVLASV